MIQWIKFPTNGTGKASADRLVESIRRETRQTYSAEEKIRIVLAGLRGEESISALCRREGISESLYYSWSINSNGSRRNKMQVVERQTDCSGGKLTAFGARNHFGVRIVCDWIAAQTDQV